MMQMKLHLACSLLVLHASTTLAQNRDQNGTVILQAIDIESGETISGATFAIENSLAEDWATVVGKSNDGGQLKLQTPPRPGYFYSLFPTPKSYKVVGLDAIPAGIVPGKTVEHVFYLRKRDASVDVPDLIPRPENPVRQLPPPTKLKNSVFSETTTDQMPGFENQTVRFRFSSGPSVDAQENQREIAEDLFRNGKRLRAAIKDELEFFQKAEQEKAGNIERIEGVIINLNPDGWTVLCRTDGGIKLKQNGFKIRFSADFQRWDLQVPDYLHPDF